MTLQNEQWYKEHRHSQPTYRTPGSSFATRLFSRQCASDHTPRIRHTCQVPTDLETQLIKLPCMGTFTGLPELVPEIIILRSGALREVLLPKYTDVAPQPTKP